MCLWFGLVDWGPWEDPTIYLSTCGPFPSGMSLSPERTPHLSCLVLSRPQGSLEALMSSFQVGPGPWLRYWPHPLRILLCPSLCFVDFYPFFLLHHPFLGERKKKHVVSAPPHTHLSRKPAPSLSLVLCEVFPLPRQETVYILLVVWKLQCLYLSL